MPVHIVISPNVKMAQIVIILSYSQRVTPNWRIPHSYSYTLYPTQCHHTVHK